MYKTILLLSGAFLLAVAPARMDAQNFDTSGTPGLSGQYLFRYVNFFNDVSGNVTESCSLTGVITFDGAGKYTTSNTQLSDSAGASTGSCAPLGGGTYGVQSNGLAQLDNPLYPATLFGSFSKPVVIASSTEDFYFDLFIAVQAPSTPLSNSSLSGAFTVGTLDFLNASNTLARQGYFTMNADGKGNIAAFTVTGSMANSSATKVTQSVSGATYALSGTAAGTLTVPLSTNATNQTQVISGTKVLYVSADGNYVIGGSATGSDMIFGFRAPSGTISNSLLNGTYFTAGMDADVSSNFLDAFYGAINANGAGALLWHERFDDIVDQLTWDNTFDTPVTIGSDGSYFDGTYTTLAGANGKAMMLVGSGHLFSLNIGIQAPSVTPTSTVWIYPTGITNAANFTPITNAYSPGELVTLFGNFGATGGTDKVLPIPTSLDGVEVKVNGRSAPVYSVSGSQISTLIPYEVSGEYFATFQVVVNGSESNTVTVYVDNTSPGIYTPSGTGMGGGSILHANYSLVSDSSPATAGETVQLFMNGLGTVTPSVGDGAAGAGSPLSNADSSLNISVVLNDGVDNPQPATVEYAGLAPGFAGLYQVNFTVPSSGLGNGHVTVSFNTLEASNSMSTISLAGFPHAAAQIAPGRGTARLRSRALARGALRTRGVKSTRRALPDRVTALGK